MPELPHLRVRCSKTDDIFLRVLKVSSRWGLCLSCEKMIIQIFPLNFWLLLIHPLKLQFYMEQLKWFPSLLTISKALRVPSSIGNNWSLSFVEVCTLLLTNIFCENVGTGGRTSPTASKPLCPRNRTVNIRWLWRFLNESCFQFLSRMYCQKLAYTHLVHFGHVQPLYH